jgi:hypothetical protein
MASCLFGYLTWRLFAGMLRKVRQCRCRRESDRVGLWTEMAPGAQSKDQRVKNPFSRAAESACEAVEGPEPGSTADAGAARDRQPGRDLTLSSVRGYESGVLRVKKEIPE